jgi:hypothetical protein
MNDNYISYIAFESATARQERTIKRIWILCIALLIALVGSNIGWICYENQFEEVSVTQEVDATADGSSNINLNTVGGDYNGGKG